MHVVPAQAGTSSGQAPTSPQADLVHVALETAKGRILIALDRGRAPVSTANFLRYVEAKRFDEVREETIRQLRSMRKMFVAPVNKCPQPLDRAASDV